MFFYEGYTCPVCGKPFTESDDIVACPVCGAPHHRACWQSEGQCHYAAAHGTPQQWRKEDAPTVTPPAEAAGNRCPRCGYTNPEYAEFCARCGGELPLPSEPVTPPVYGEYAPYRAAPPSDGPIGGVDSADLAAAVGSRTDYYMPRFRRMEEGGVRFSWNWAAALLTPYWLFYRKQYLAGTLVLLLSIALAAVTTVIFTVVLGPVLGEDPYSEAAAAALAAGLADGTLRGPVNAVFLINGVQLLLRLFFGAFGNQLYYQTCLRRVTRFRQRRPDGYPAEITALGGTSVLLGMVAYLLTEFVSYLVLSLLQ